MLLQQIEWLATGTRRLRRPFGDGVPNVVQRGLYLLQRKLALVIANMYTFGRNIGFYSLDARQLAERAVDCPDAVVATDIRDRKNLLMKRSHTYLLWLRCCMLCG